MGSAPTFPSLFPINFTIRIFVTTDELLNHKRHIHPALVLQFFFGLKSPFHFTPLLNLRCHVFCLTPFCWLLPVTLTRSFSWEYHFLFTPSFSGTQLWCKLRAWFNKQIPNGCRDAMEVSPLHVSYFLFVSFFFFFGLVNYFP